VNVDPGGGQPGLERSLEQIARDAGVLANQHGQPVASALGQDPTRGMTQAHYEIRRDRRLTHLAADAIGTKVFAGHGKKISGKCCPQG